MEIKELKKELRKRIKRVLGITSKGREKLKENCDYILSNGYRYNLEEMMVMMLPEYDNLDRVSLTTGLIEEIDGIRDLEDTRKEYIFKRVTKNVDDYYFNIDSKDDAVILFNCMEEIMCDELLLWRKFTFSSGLSKDVRLRAAGVDSILHDSLKKIRKIIDDYQNSQDNFDKTKEVFSKVFPLFQTHTDLFSDFIDKYASKEWQEENGHEEIKKKYTSFRLTLTGGTLVKYINKKEEDDN